MIVITSRPGAEPVSSDSATLGLELGPAENAVKAGTTEVWNLLVSGRLKAMASLTNWIREFRKYHRDDKGSGRSSSGTTT